MASHRYDPPRPAILLAALLVGVAAFVRLQGVGWDGFASLHPDERHLLFVTFDMFRALDDPAHASLSLAQWWLSADSPLNPRAGGGQFVYGEAPLLAVMVLARLTGTGGWPEVMALGRTAAAVVDSTAVLAVFLAARPLAGPWRALGGAALYAAMPTALQLANFHTVDAWLAAACAWALVPLAALAQGPRSLRAALGLGLAAGAFGGLAVACKVTGGLLLLPALAALALARARGLGWGGVAAAALAGLGAALLVLRLANPFAFAGPWGIGLDPRWLADLRALLETTASPDFPPNWQWMAGYGPWRTLRDVALFGAGPVACLLAALALWRPPPAGRAALLPPLLLALATVGLTAAGTIAALRYAAPALPALAVLAAAGLGALPRPAALAAVALALWWGAGAVRLHDGQHPRLAASLWLWTLPRGTVLANETGWDEGLPVPVRVDPAGTPRWADWEGWFTLTDLDIVAPDTPEKARRLAQAIARADYVILSSDRQSAVMPRLPDRFPLTTEHYRLLRSGKACLALALRLDRGYPLPGLRLDDSWAQEPWRVYDHPIVEVWRREPCFDAAAYEAALLAALPPPG